MPAERVTSYSPWHIILILDDSQSMHGDPIRNVNAAVRAMIEEMILLSGGMKPYFRLSVIKFGSSAELLCEAMSEKDVDLDKIASLGGTSGATNAAAAIDVAREVLERNPGKPTDFEPFVFFFSDGVPFDGTSEEASRVAALTAGERLKKLKIPCGVVRLVTAGFGSVDDRFMADLSSHNKNGEPRYKKLDSPKAVLGWLPDIGTVAASQSSAPGTSAADRVEEAIMDL
jgi:uncharacterized protein YegL